MQRTKSKCVYSNRILLLWCQMLRICLRNNYWLWGQSGLQEIREREREREREGEIENQWSNQWHLIQNWLIKYQAHVPLQWQLLHQNITESPVHSLVTASKKKNTKEQNPLYTVWASKSYDDSKNEAAKSHSLYMHDP